MLMTHLNTPYFRQDADIVNAAPSGSFVHAWLYWIRVWLGLCCTQGHKEALEDAGYITIETHMKMPVRNREHRRWRAYYVRCGSTLAAEYNLLRRLMPRGLTPTQRLEQMCKVSHLGRVRLYRLEKSARILRGGDIALYYDFCDWRTPLLRTGTESLHPP